EVATPHHSYSLHARRFERPIDPAAATAARQAHVPVRVIIKRNEDEWFGHLAHPQRREMMEISGAEEDERFLWRLLIKLFHQPRGRGEAKRRPPSGGIQRPKRERNSGPGIIQIKMQS